MREAARACRVGAQRSGMEAETVCTAVQYRFLGALNEGTQEASVHGDEYGGGPLLIQLATSVNGGQASGAGSI